MFQLCCSCIMDISRQSSFQSCAISPYLWCSCCSSYCFHFVSYFPFPWLLPSLILFFPSSVAFEFGIFFLPLIFCLSNPTSLLCMAHHRTQGPLFSSPHALLTLQPFEGWQVCTKPNSWLRLPCTTHPLAHILESITLQNVSIFGNGNIVDKKKTFL